MLDDTANAKGSRGVLYIATGPEHIRAALRSARSVRAANPELAIHLFSDYQLQNVQFDLESGPLTSWAGITQPHRRSKVDYMVRTPFSETLYLDTDTRVLCNLDDVFCLLEKFDVALAHAHKREVQAKQAMVRIQTPQAFPQFNSGVFLYRSNAQTVRALEQWREWFYETNLRTDQNTLREVLWASDLRIATLPPEYNVRFLKYPLMWSRDEARPRILHLPYYKQGLSTYLKRWYRKVLRMARRS
jgi:hypothetical protein